MRCTAGIDAAIVAESEVSDTPTGFKSSEDENAKLKASCAVYDHNDVLKDSAGKSLTTPNVRRV